jgi:hypothetical protein
MHVGAYFALQTGELGVAVQPVMHTCQHATDWRGGGMFGMCWGEKRASCVAAGRRQDCMKVADGVGSI